MVLYFLSTVANVHSLMRAGLYQALTVSLLFEFSMLLFKDYIYYEHNDKTSLAQTMHDTSLTYNGIISVIGLANSGVETLGQTASGQEYHSFS